MAEIGNLLDDVKRLERKVVALEEAVKILGLALQRQHPAGAELIQQFMEELGLWHTPKSRTRARR